MKTLHLTNAYHPTSGGIRTFYTALLDAAARERRDVVLVVPGAQDSCTRTAGGRIYTVRAPRAPIFDRRYRLILPHRYVPGLNTRLIRILEEEQPDLVEVCDKYALPYLAAMVRRHWHPRVPRPTLVGLSCERFDDNMGAYVSREQGPRRFTQWYIRHIYGPPFDYHVANSAYTAQELRTALHDRPPDFIRVTSMGVDTDAFGPRHRSAALRARLLRRAGGHAQSTLLMYAGRLSPEKNLPLLVETLNTLVGRGGRDYRLVLAGDGPLRQWIMSLPLRVIAQRIHLCGALSREDTAAHVASCDVFVHPNPREPFGIGPLEAMASGVPVVVPDRGGVLEYASPVNAWLAPPQAGAFADAVEAAAAGSADRRQAAIETARRFAWAATTRRYFALYDELHARRIGSRDGPRGVSAPLRVASTVHA